MSNKCDLVVFDFDGTLANTKPLFSKYCVEHTHVEGLGNCNLSELHRAFGAPDISGLSFGWNCLESEKKSHLLKIYDKTDHAILSDKEVVDLFPFVSETLQGLCDKGYEIGIVTSRPSAPTIHILKQHNIYKYIKSIRSFDDVLSKSHRAKPYPDKLLSLIEELGCEASRTWMIGDTIMDLQMSINAATNTVGVDWGFGEVEDLLAYEVPILSENFIGLYNILNE